MEKWKKVRTKETVHFGKYYHVQVDEVITPGGKPSTYSVVRLHPFSVIVPMDSEGRIHLVRQHRYATDTKTPIVKIELQRLLSFPNKMLQVL